MEKSLANDDEKTKDIAPQSDFNRKGEKEMPRKITTFADKVKQETHVDYCPKCGGAIEQILYVTSYKSSAGCWKFRQRHMGVCKCNHDEIYK